MVFSILVVDLKLGGCRSNSCLRNKFGDLCSVPSASVAQIESIVLICSATNFGIGRFIHSATA